jgi:hypothetical protein
MSTDSHFLSHLRHSSERVKDWPSWKTGMWQTENKDPQGRDTSPAQQQKNTLPLYRPGKK